METLSSWKIDSSNPNDGQESIYVALAVLVATRGSFSIDDGDGS